MYLHQVDTMRGTVRRWGNGLALRVRKKDLETAGVSEGDVVEVRVRRRSERVVFDLDAMPTFEDPDPRSSIRHDRYLYG